MRNKKYYPTLHDLLASGYAGTVQNNLFSSIHWFDGTLTYTDFNGETQYYPDLDFTPAELWQVWSMLYEELRIGYQCKCVNPFSGPSAAEWTECAANFLAKAQAWLKLNENKFLGLVKTYGYKYDPISNYDMVEVEGKAEKESNYEVANTITGKLITDVDSPEMQSKAYSTTYDDASDTRLSSRTTTEYGGSSNTSNGYRVEQVSGEGTTVNIPIIRTAQSMEGENPKIATVSGYERGEGKDQSVEWKEGNETLVKTPDGNRAEARKLTRKGNIGVMTSQQMIESERELARQNIVEEFFREFNKGVMGVWL